MKVGLHQGSVLSPLLVAAVMNVVSSEARSGLPSELLYADDLVQWNSLAIGWLIIVNSGKCLWERIQALCSVHNLLKK